MENVLILGREFFVLALGFSSGSPRRQNPPPLVREFALVRGFSRSGQKWYRSNEGRVLEVGLGEKISSSGFVAGF